MAEASEEAGYNIFCTTESGIGAINGSGIELHQNLVFVESRSIYLCQSYNLRISIFCIDNGFHFAYLNHDYTFKEVEGVMPQDFLLENTDKDLVDFEMDIYWVVAAGKGPQENLKKYEDRWKLCHSKDLI